MRLLVFLILIISVTTAFDENIKILISALFDVLNFVESHYYQINFDGLLGVVIAESQLLQILKILPGGNNFRNLILKCEDIKSRIEPTLPNFPKYTTYKKYLLQPPSWENNNTFVQNHLKNLGVYDWTPQMFLENKAAIYNGIPTDVCILEILEQDSKECRVSPMCFEMMLAKRIDKGYLLTHRLLYLQIARIKGCRIDPQQLQAYSREYCSFMLKEARTNKLLGFPQHDIVLEQILLCGLEGYEEFLTNEFRSFVVKWKSRYGCYHPDYDNVSRRAANRIDFGCTDHATGLGAAALALNLRYLVEKCFKERN